MILLYQYYKVFYNIIFTIEFFIFGYTLGFIAEHFMAHQYFQNISIFEFYSLLDVGIRYYHFSILPIVVLIIGTVSIIVYVCNGLFISNVLLQQIHLEASIFIREFMPYLVIIGIIFSITTILENIYRLHIDSIFLDTVSQVGYSYFLLLGINVFFFNLVVYLLLNYASCILFFVIQYRRVYNSIFNKEKEYGTTKKNIL